MIEIGSCRIARLIGIGGACLPLLTSAFSRADYWVQPVEFETWSENNRFVARVTPRDSKSKPLLVVSSIENGQTNQIWRAELSNPVCPIRVYLSDDGESVVTLDNWFKNGYGDDVVAIYGRNGQGAKYALEQVAPPPAQTASRRPFGGYKNNFPHTVSSRQWRENSIEFFYPEADQMLFCLWLDWNLRWAAWRMSDGKPVPVYADRIRRFTIEGRRRVLRELESAHISQGTLNFLGRMGFPEDRPLVEEWLRDTIFSSGSTQTYSSDGAKPEIVFTARSWKREAADRILARWGSRDRGGAWLGSLERYQNLGILKCVVSFASAPEKGEGTIRLYLLPEDTPLDRWAASRPTHYLIGDLNDRFLILEEAANAALPSEIDFIIYGVTPGKYRLKAVWDKAEPFAARNEIVCRPQNGDYESIDSPVLAIQKASETGRVRIECKTPVSVIR